MKKKIPNLGIGIGLRPVHYEEIFRDKPDIDWFEIISENFMVDCGKPIESGRLEVKPSAIYCLKCEGELEKKRR